MNIALILSGGVGTRLNSNIPKQYIKCNNQMIITYCLKTFSSIESIDGIWIVCNPDWQEEIVADIKKSNILASTILGFSSPGDNRQLSILNGLLDIEKYLADSNTSDSDSIIIVHDAARPNISSELILKGIESINGHDGVMPAIPMKDTVYLCDDNSRISSLLNRSKIYAGQAPEFFYLKKYLEANKMLLPDKILSINGSTEPAILANLDIITIPGDENNYKITTLTDLNRFKDSLTR